MYQNNLVTMGMTKDGKYLSVIPKMANRHGLIAGATGTGKTITLKVMAEAFSDAGVPVFLSDVKGDLAGMVMNGTDSEDMQSRINYFGLADLGYSYKSYPTRFWDIYGAKGLPMRTTVTEFGPLLLSRVLGLNQTQSDILNIVFKIADSEQLLLIDLKDLKAALNYCSENASDFKAEYGNIAPQSAAAIMRSLVSLEDKGADRFFGEPALDIVDLFKTTDSGKGFINVLDSESLINDTTVYSTFLLWLLSELFELLPEVGDQEKPKMVFFFDEAHLLFEDAPKALLQKIEQVVKLIRSKGVGIYFVTQNPRDIPDGVLAQLGNKVQHALHAYTPAERKGIKAAAESFRVNPAFDTEEAIQNLGTGEALVSFLMEDGSPSEAEIVKILPPQSKMGGIEDNLRNQTIASDALRDKYSDMIDRDSAYEFLQRKAQLIADEEEKEALAKLEAKEAEKAAREAEKAKEKESKTVKRAIKNVGKSAASSVGRELGKAVGKGFGSTGKTIAGNIGSSLGRGLLDTIFKL